MSQDLVLIKRSINDKPEVVKIAVGDEVVIHDVKFIITYTRINPIRISLEPKPYEAQREEAVDENLEAFKIKNQA